MASLSTAFTFTSPFGPQLSESGEYIAYITGGRLVVRSSTTLATKRIFNLPVDFARFISSIRWDCSIPNSSEQRLALVSKDQVLIFSIDSHSSIEESSQWTTLLPGAGGVTDVEWKSTRYGEATSTRRRGGRLSSISLSSNSDSQMIRLIVFSRNALMATVWSSDNLELEINSPKMPRCLPSRRPDEVSILTRQTTLDVVRSFSIHEVSAASEREIVKSIALTGIIDAKIVKWSLSGLYLAASETPSMGYKICIYGHNGHPLGSFTNKDAIEGVTSLQWIVHAQTGKDVLLIGSTDERILALNMINFKPIFELRHGSVFKSSPVWVESASLDKNQLDYSLARMPYYPPRVMQLPSTREMLIKGVPILKTSHDGKFLASIVNSMPASVWLWRLDADIPHLAAVINHSSPINNIQWNGKEQLLIVPNEGSLIGIWGANEKSPLLLDWSANYQTIHGGVWANGRVLIWDRKSFAVVTIHDPVRVDANDSSENYPGATSNGALIEADSSNVRSGQVMPEDGSLSGEAFAGVRSFERAKSDVSESDVADLLRHGSPQLLQDDDTHAREIANAVQQFEWTEAPENILPDDTFHVSPYR